MEKFISRKGFREHEFEVVDSIPFGGYTIWNIGENIEDGYLPIVQVGGYDGCQVNTRTMKVIKVDGAQIILSAIGRGQGTLKEMETYIKRYRNSKTESTKTHVEKLKNAVKVMRTINGVENLN